MTATERAAKGTTCDECRRRGVRIVRVHRGERFCEACYKRLFKRRMCPQCGNFARLPRLEPHAVCLTCENARPCVRCGRTGVRVGMRTPYGPACIACTPYFKPAEACERCGTPSRWLSRRKELEHDLRLCPRCARAGHETCEACRRHRALEPAADGRRLCRACTEQGEIPCPECRRPRPAGCGKRCWDCYWKEVAEHRIRLNAAGLASPALAQRFADFGAWLVAKTGPRKTALNVKRYLEFFLQIGREWDDIPEYGALLRHFGAAGLRRRLLAVRWMDAAGLVVVDADAREAESERRRIEAILNRLPAGSPAAVVLAGYHATLRARAKAGKCTLRSVRLTLSPAAGLLEIASAGRGLPPDQRTLEAFLRQSPGQQAAISSFVTYLRRAYGTELAVPRRNALQRQKERRAKLLPELLAVMRETGDTRTADRRWLRIALQYFHDLPARAGKNAADDDVATDAEGITVRVKNQSYWIPWPNRAAGASTTSPDPDAINPLHRGRARENIT